MRGLFHRRSEREKSMRAQARKLEASAARIAARIARAEEAIRRAEKSADQLDAVLASARILFAGAALPPWYEDHQATAAQWHREVESARMEIESLQQVRQRFVDAREALAAQSR